VLGVERYVGADVMPSLIEELNKTFAATGREFWTLDATSDQLPQVDMIFCRDCLVHFSFEDAQKTLANFRRSASRYFVGTTFPDRQRNIDIRTGEWRPLNLCAAPFDLPPPIRLINEGCTEDDLKFTDKSLGVWRVGDL